MDTKLDHARAARPAPVSTTEDVARRPSIYAVHPLLAGDLPRWPELLAHVARMGFSHVSIAPPFRPAASGNIFLVADHNHLHPRIATGDAAAASVGLASIIAAARGAGLVPLLDVPLDHVAADGPLARRAPEVFETNVVDTLDPRGDAADLEGARTRDNAPAAIDWWAARLAVWRAAGFGGFRLIGLSRLSAAFVHGLVGRVRETDPDAMLIGWTVGMSSLSRAALAGARFDFVASSLPWWDFRAGWLAEEVAMLDAIAPTLAAPEAPFAPRLPSILGLTDAAHATERAHAYSRALDFAAATGAALLVPMGFEYGDPHPLSPASGTYASFASLATAPVLDLTNAVAHANSERRANGTIARAQRPLLGPGEPAVAMLGTDAADARFAGRATIVLANGMLDRATTLPASRLLPALGDRFPRFERIGGASDDVATLRAGDEVTLAPGEVTVFAADAVETPPAAATPDVEGATQAGHAPRYAIEAVRPSVDDGRFPVKRLAGETVVVEADIIPDGHEVLGAALRYRKQGNDQWTEARMRPLGNDRYAADLPLDGTGTFVFAIEAWRDAFGTFHDELSKKVAADVPTALEVEEGYRLVASMAHRSAAVAALSAMLNDVGEEMRREVLLSAPTVETMAAADPRPFRVVSNEYTVLAERPGAAFASWYEVFPRSMSDDVTRHGTFADVIRHLPRIRAMGFDVLYFPPIHPIGRAFRKGRNNTLTPAPDDPGSPYAIGSEDGGHDAIHPELGDFEQFRALIAAAHAHGIEIAIDYAIQCSPDHPWLREHPEWFAHRPDGSIKYAENPPKKYQDIVNVDFYADGAIPSLWLALRDVVLFWASEGVRLFRVDNPHTKPFPFWEWMIASVRAIYPDAIFLAEAFTRPKVMYRLAKLGFSQSYTYFTWRNEKWELQDYLIDLTTGAPRDFFRPHFFVNTPDINPPFLQTGSRPAHLIRAALAATLSGLWGVYNGFELCEATPLPGREEYLDSEKYQLRAWDWKRPGNIVAEVTALNRIRRDNPALHTHLGVTFLACDNDRVLWFEKATEDRANVLLIAISLDPFGARETAAEVPLWRWRDKPGWLLIEDVLDGTATVWHGNSQRLRLTPELPYRIWRARPDRTA